LIPVIALARQCSADLQRRFDSFVFTAEARPGSDNVIHPGLPKEVSLLNALDLPVLTQQVEEVVSDEIAYARTCREAQNFKELADAGKFELPMDCTTPRDVGSRKVSLPPITDMGQQVPVAPAYRTTAAEQGLQSKAKPAGSAREWLDRIPAIPKHSEPSVVSAPPTRPTTPSECVVIPGEISDPVESEGPTIRLLVPEQSPVSKSVPIAKTYLSRPPGMPPMMPSGSLGVPPAGFASDPVTSMLPPAPNTDPFLQVLRTKAKSPPPLPNMSTYFADRRNPNTELGRRTLEDEALGPRPPHRQNSRREPINRRD